MSAKDLDCQLSTDTQYLWHPYSVPPTHDAGRALNQAEKSGLYHVDHAQGVYLTLSDGSQLIDAMSSWWSVIHGYNQPHINQAMNQQIEQMSHVMFGGLTHRPAIELAKRLLAVTPASLSSVFYCDSGSVAVEVAMKMALQYQHSIEQYKKKAFLTVRSGYYGDTWNAMSVCDPDTGMHHLFKGALNIQYFADQPPIAYTQEWQEDESTNGIASLRSILQDNGEHIAAMIIEPVVQGTGGMYFYHPEYLNQCKVLCEEHGVLLIFDEIATGFARTGRLFATQHCNIEPDIMCVGKALTGGYLSFAATLCCDKVAHGIAQGSAPTFMHGPTFMANPLACSAAIASLELLEKSDYLPKILQIEQQFKRQLLPANDLPNVADVRAMGAIGVIEMKHPVDVQLAHTMCKELGVWLRPFGKNIYSMPPYIVSESELTQITNAMIQLAKNEP